MPTSDEILIHRCCEGDEEAWEALVRRYGPLVRSAARRQGLPPDVCDDVCQDVFATLVKNLGTLRDARSVSGWLLTVTRRRCIREFERNEPRAVPEGVESDVDAPELTAEEWEERVALMRALEELDSPCDDLIRALFLDRTEPDYATIARRLKRPIGSIGPTRRRCLARLARLLRKQAREGEPERSAEAQS